MGLTACNELDKETLSNAVTTDQKEEALEMNPELAQAAVNAIPTGNYLRMPVYGASGNVHSDFGLPSVMMMLDSFGQDFVSANVGYNWYRFAVGLDVGSTTSQETNIIWYTCYNQIKSCNDVLATISPETEDDLLKFYRAQGLSARAFYYWVLSQVYQKNYEGNEMLPCVPIITDENEEEAAAEGSPRASVKDVYDFIISDLNQAVDLLSSTPVKAQSVMPTKPKRFFNLDAAYGMLARVYLTMHDYENALQAAQKCLNVTSCRPYTIDEVNHPTFINLDDPSWLWGQPVSTQDPVVLSGIVNFPSMMGSFCYGYAQYGGWRWCNSNLFNWIPDTDVRKGWFLDSNWESPNLNAAYNAYIAAQGTKNDPNNTSDMKMLTYTQVKYAPYNYEIDTDENASDIPYFRIEEVYLIMYEAMAMTGDISGAQSGLTNFIRTYRNPDYTCTATSQAALQNEIWMHRRVEFWGEGFVSWFDLKRLGKPLDRRNVGYPTSYTYYEGPESPIWVLPIPQRETQYNKQLTQADNNPSWIKPTPVVSE